MSKPATQTPDELSAPLAVKTRKAEIEKRAALSTTGSMTEVAMQLAEGNMGAAQVLVAIVRGGNITNGFLSLLDLDDMNIRGEQIWIGFKDHCGEDLEKFLKCLRDRDSAMVLTVNSRCNGHRAVTGGASFNR